MDKQLMNKQGGFTLIELVVVIVILGILAATAIPRFADMGRDARIAALNGAKGAVASAAALARAQALIANQTGATGSITMEGQTVSLVYGYPSATAQGIGAALALLDGVTPTYTTGVVTYASTATSASNCSFTYTQATATVAAQAAGLNTNGC